MGLFKKIKDIFYDEVEVPVKEEIKKEEKPTIQSISPKDDNVRSFRGIEPEEKVNNFSERELFRAEKTFDFPVFEEEEEEEPVKTRSKSNILELQKELEEKATNPSRREDYVRRVNEVEVEKTTFRPSPVISPVYGILDKNYTKEEVVEKKETVVRPHSGEMSYDYVRRKAYGTLEDELEDTLTRVNSEIIDSVNELEKEINSIPKSSKNIEDLLDQIEKNANVSIGELEEAAKDKLIEEEEEDTESFEEETYVPKRAEKKEEVNDNTLEHDLFNLIDSMYEDKE